MSRELDLAVLDFGGELGGFVWVDVRIFFFTHHHHWPLTTISVTFDEI